MAANSQEEERERYGELLQELRVMIPGVEVLFAFLLTSVFRVASSTSMAWGVTSSRSPSSRRR